jgi:hypothetical protein
MKRFVQNLPFLFLLNYMNSTDFNPGVGLEIKKLQKIVKK